MTISRHIRCVLAFFLGTCQACASACPSNIGGVEKLTAGMKLIEESEEHFNYQGGGQKVLGYKTIGVWVQKNGERIEMAIVGLPGKPNSYLKKIEQNFVHSAPFTCNEITEVCDWAPKADVKIGDLENMTLQETIYFPGNTTLICQYVSSQPNSAGVLYRLQKEKRN